MSNDKDTPDTQSAGQAKSQVPRYTVAHIEQLTPTSREHVPFPVPTNEDAPARAGDSIRPKGIDGVWVVAGVYKWGQVISAGWPAAVLQPGEYAVVGRCSDSDHEKMLLRVAESKGGNPARSLAIEALRKMGKLPPTPLEATQSRIAELEKEVITLKANLSGLNASREMLTKCIEGTRVERDAAEKEAGELKARFELLQSQSAPQTDPSKAEKERAVIEAVAYWRGLAIHDAALVYPEQVVIDALRKIRDAYYDALNSPPTEQGESK